MIRSTPFRAPARGRLRSLFVVGLAAVLAGCSSDGNVPDCENCDLWTQITPGLGRFADPHPDRTGFFAFSTVDKTPGADDSNREADEDLWLIWTDGGGDAAANVRWQLTADEMGTSGDNFGARWSPSGDQLAFVHTDGSGTYEVWRLAVTLPADPNSGSASPTLGAPERIETDARDPEWISDTDLMFTRDDKLFRVTVAPPAPRGGGSVQLSFNPPIYTSTEEFVDRHPDLSPDGGGVFNTIGRQPVGSIFVRAFEVDSSAVPVVQETDAFVYLQAPGALPTFPVVESGDTLRTPSDMTSLPLGDGTQFEVGVSLDAIVLQDTTGVRNTYCDTTLTAIVDLEPGDVDSLTFYFQDVRGTLHVSSTRGVTSVSWTATSPGGAFYNNLLFPGSHVLDNVGDVRIYDCVPSYEFNAMGVPTPPAFETYMVSGSEGGNSYDTTVTVAPGDTAFVVLFPGGEPGAEPEGSRTGRVTRSSNRAEPRHGSGTSIARAPGDLSTVWRLEFPTADRASFEEITGSVGLIQHPVISDELGGGLRYIAYVTDESGDWRLMLQRLVNWEAIDDPIEVPTPGSFDNLTCDRAVFHPRFLPSTTSSVVRLVVSLADCPDNGFEDIGFDDDPWAIGEVRVWEVEYAP